MRRNALRGWRLALSGVVHALMLAFSCAVAVPARATAQAKSECKLACRVTGIGDGCTKLQFPPLLRHLFGFSLQCDGALLPDA